MVKVKVMPALRQVLTLGILMMLTASCATDSHRPLLTLELEAKPDAGAMTSAQTFKKMIELVADDESLRPFVEDLLVLAKAESLVEEQKFAEAEGYYLKALILDKGSVGRLAFDSWARLQPKIDVANGHNPDFLAGKLLASTKNGAESAWLKRQSLTDKTSLSKRLEKLIGIRHETSTVASVPRPSLPAPESYSPVDDVFFEARAKAICRKPLDMKWVSWVSSLTVAQRVYWNGLILNCSADPRQASVEFLNAISMLSTSPEDTARVVRSAELLIQTLKAIGDRVGATEAYATQMSILRREDLPLDLLNWSPYDKQKKFIDASYWVARNRAMHGDYVRGRQAAEEGLEGLGLLQTLAKTPKQEAEIIELKVEGLHVISSRIQYEQQDFAGALQLNAQALTTPGINKEWRQRLLWAEAWYQFRKGDKKLTIAALDRYLKEDLEDSSKTKALFWRGRAFWEDGKKDEAERDFEELKRIAPLSFYSVVGITSVDPDEDWTDNFKSVDKDQLSKIEDFEWGAYRQDSDALRKFHRLEFAVASSFGLAYSGLANELFGVINGKGKLLREVEPSLYATRLMNMAEQYVLSISLSATLSNIHDGLWADYPEQLLIFFPNAYRADVAKHAAKNALEPDLVWALSRQESSFRKAVESPVGAIGLMQLMPNTAQGLATSIGLPTSGISERLKEPDLNLQLGTLYLSNLGKRYQGKWPRAIAAYNAGEYVVDTWMLRRDAPDLITWAEALSFSETSSYVKNVWRNWEVYRWLGKQR